MKVFEKIIQKIIFQLKIIERYISHIPLSEGLHQYPDIEGIYRKIAPFQLLPVQVFFVVFENCVNYISGIRILPGFFGICRRVFWSVRGFHA